MVAAPSIGERATLLAQQGRTQQAITELDQAAARNDADALFTLAVWRLAGSLMQRDLTLSRDLFRRACDAGHATGCQIYNAFLASGTGGPADWQAAIGLLRRRATADAGAAADLALIETMRLTPQGDPVDTPIGRPLSTSPHVVLFPKAFTAAACRYLIDSAEPLLQPALTVHPQTGQRLPNPVRTSDAAGFPLAQEGPAVHAINRRIAAISGLPASHGEPLQVLRYRPGQQYRPHHDALPGSDNQRVVTVLVYLNDGYEGGETHFLANCLSIRGEIGDALLFRNVRSDGRPDERSAHAGLPVVKGEKMIASRWIRAGPLDLGDKRVS